MKRPEIGDRIKHREPAFARENEGNVIEILSQQFVYKTDKGEERFCLFRELWEIVK